MDVHANSYPNRGKGWEGGWMEPLPGVFYMLQYFGTILLSMVSLGRSYQDEIHFMGGDAAKDCDVTNNGHHLGFHQELEIWLKLGEIVIFFVLDMKNNT